MQFYPSLSDGLELPYGLDSGHGGTEESFIVARLHQGPWVLSLPGAQHTPTLILTPLIYCSFLHFFLRAGPHGLDSAHGGREESFIDASLRQESLPGLTTI